LAAAGQRCNIAPIDSEAARRTKLPGSPDSSLSLRMARGGVVLRRTDFYLAQLLGRMPPSRGVRTAEFID
jgi:hypothetical protein